MKPQTIQIFLPDGSPNGIKEAELTNRLIKVILFPRTAMENVMKREIVKYTGVYFLFGENEEGKPQVYIGEGESCWERIKAHHRNKDFWTHCIVATTKTDELTKTDGKFLEHYCLKQAKRINRYQIENDTGSNEPSVSEPKRHDLLDNFENIKVLISTLGYPVFDDIRGQKTTQQELFYCQGKDAKAKCILTNEGYLVLSGSTANLEEANSLRTTVKNKRDELIQVGVLVKNSKIIEFIDDYIFKTPSAASDLILARSSNGWIEWKNKNGKTLDELKRK